MLCALYIVLKKDRSLKKDRWREGNAGAPQKILKITFSRLAKFTYEIKFCFVYCIIILSF
jgi:hypothetical protein